MAKTAQLPTCRCHGDAMIWRKDVRCVLNNGYWTCGTSLRERQATWKRDKYDANPVWRIETLLKHAKQKRRKHLVDVAPKPALIELLKEARQRGEIPEQRRSRPSMEPGTATHHA